MLKPSLKIENVHKMAQKFGYPVEVMGYIKNGNLQIYTKIFELLGFSKLS
jgi:hypothetical protein